MSRLRRPFLSDRYFFVAPRPSRRPLRPAALAFRKKPRAVKARATKTWHAICAQVYPRTFSLVTKSFKASSTILINRRRGERGEFWQARFFDRALRTVKEYNDKVDSIRLNPVREGLAERAEEWPWFSVREYSGSG